MFTSDAMMAKINYEERLKEAAEERLAIQVLVRTPRVELRLLGKIGELLISVGTSLKLLTDQTPQKATF